jgi:hypothetical protein
MAALQRAFAAAPIILENQPSLPNFSAELAIAGSDIEQFGLAGRRIR